METGIGTQVVGEGSLRGRITDHAQDGDGTPLVVITFDDGSSVRIPAALLVMRSDGSAFVPLHQSDISQAAGSQTSETTVIPVIAEALQVAKRTVEHGRVRVRKVVHERDEVVDEPLLREEVEVSRVAVNQQVDTPPEVRREGDTLIVPIVEEILVVEKRLLLKEELLITRRQTTVHDPQTVSLREEEVIVDHLSPTDEPQERQ